ncbi:MAG: 7-carboxy-7-deazaguanine synthase QueE [Puniceicoccales bacterium]|jgi:organic radical activating enzyme|nr:7-carboxy-7-deazaguanine synthase QueE [Puniceicoccales bacterium]
MKNDYPVHETFFSFQGEGAYMGRAAFFVRLSGCPLRCPWCDSADTWDGSAPRAGRISARELAMQAWPTRAEFAVITGGEPTIHDLTALTTAIRGMGLPVHLETCGAFPLRGDFDWVTLSPKRAAAPLPQNLMRADEIKLIIETPADLVFWAEALQKKCVGSADVSGNVGLLGRSSLLRSPIVWLHPEWSHRSDPAVLSAITRWVLGRGAPYRAGWQLHKCYGAE